MCHHEHNKDYDQCKVNGCLARYSPQDSGKKEHTMTKAKKDKDRYKKRKKRTKTIKDMTRTKTKPEIHHHPEILQLGTIGHPARGEHGSIIR